MKGRAAYRKSVVKTPKATTITTSVKKQSPAKLSRGVGLRQGRVSMIKRSLKK